MTNTTKINSLEKFTKAVEAQPARRREFAIEAYKAIRSRSEARSAAEFDEAVVQYLAANKLQAGETTCVVAADRVAFKCRRCAGTGQFITMVENGQPKGPGGICYRCEGKGRQTDRDVRRNYIADITRPVYL